MKRGSGLLDRFSDILRIGYNARAWVKRRAMIGALEAFDLTPETTCPCCGHVARFWPYGIENIPGSVCPNCRSLQRHRLFKLALDDGFVSVAGKGVLHFAAEPIVAKIVKDSGAASYLSADLEPGKGDRVLNIEAIDLPSNSVDAILCFHVLEHVDDRKALAELFRVLRPGGVLVAMVPIVEGWATTFEDEGKRTDRERELYFGQNDHVRMYGADFRDRVRAAGFELAEYTADGARSVLHGLIRGEKVFRCTKPAG